MGFLLCKACQRHVRGNEASCPFCGGRELEGASPVRSRVSRTAMIGAAAVVMACSNSSPSDDAGTDAAAQDSGYDAMQAAYGGPPVEAGTDTGPAPAYGGPPLDAGKD